MHTGSAPATAKSSSARAASAPLSPLLELPNDVLACILDRLAPAELAALARTAWALHCPATRALYACVHIPSRPGSDTLPALKMLVETLEARPALGELVLRFSLQLPGLGCQLLHRDCDFDPDAQSDSDPDPLADLLARALSRMPHLRTLVLRSPIDFLIAPHSQLASALRALSSLDTLILGDATPETLAVLQHVRPVRALSILRVSVGWSPGLVDAAHGLRFLEEYLVACRGTLRELDIDGAMLEGTSLAQSLFAWVNAPILRLHGHRSNLTAASVCSTFPRAGLASQPEGISDCDCSSCYKAYQTDTPRRVTLISYICGAKASKFSWEACGLILSVVLGALCGILFLQ